MTVYCGLCGTQISSEWNACPMCRYPIDREYARYLETVKEATA